MADKTKKVCAFCKEGEDAGSLEEILENILAHSDCLLFAPKVTTTPQEDSEDSTVEYNISSVMQEIERGKTLRCVKCKKSGAAVGCDYTGCKRTYHYPCVTKAKGIAKRDEDNEEYIVYCREHANCAQLNEVTETSGTSITSACSKKLSKYKRQKKRKKKMKRHTARKKLSFAGIPDSGTVQNAEMCCDHEQRQSHQLLDNHIDEEDMEVPGPSRPHLEDTVIVLGSDTESEEDLLMFNGSQLVSIKREGTSTKDDTSVIGTPSRETVPSPAHERTSSTGTDNSSSLTPEIVHSFSLSGFPKANRKRKGKRNNPQLKKALLNMHSDERKACSQLYDEVGGSLPMSEDICDDEQVEDPSCTVEDIPKDQHTGTKAKSDGSNFKIAPLESSVSVHTTEGQFSSSTPGCDVQLPTHTLGVTSFPSRQLINVNNKVKITDGLRGTTFHPENVVNGSERLACISGEMLTSAESANSVSNASAQPTDACNGKDRLVSFSAIYHNPTKCLVDQPLSSSSTNNASDEQQLMKSPNNNMSDEQQKNYTKNELVLANLIKMLKKPTAQKCSRHASNKILGSANNDILSNTEPLSSPNFSKTSNVQPMNLIFTSNSSEEQCKQGPGVTKTSGEKPTETANTTRGLVHAVNSPDSDVPVDQRTKVLKRQSQSAAHLSAITTGTDLVNGHHSCFSLVNNKCTEIETGSPSAKKVLLPKEELTSREETPQTSPGIAGKSLKVQNSRCHPSPLHIEAFSKQLKRDNLVCEQSPEHSIVSQQNYLGIVGGNLGTSAQTEDEPASPGSPPEDECMLVEEKTHSDEDSVLLSVVDAGQTSDKPSSPGDLQENGCIVVEEITHPDEETEPLSDTTNVAALTTKSSQTEINSGFPGNVDTPMNLSIGQKSKLMESYKEAEKQMSKTGHTTKAARAFWEFCRENKCREFLLNLVTCNMESVFHKIVHEEHKDKDYEQAFAFLQTSGCFADFINGTEDDQGKNNSRITSRETYNESDSDSVCSCTEVEDQGEITRDEDTDGMGFDLPIYAQMTNKGGQWTRDEEHNKVETEWSKTSSLSVNCKEKESSGDEDHSGMQSELSEPSLESNRKEESCRGKDHDIRRQLCESCSESSREEQSTGGEDLDRIEMESPAASLFSPSASSKSDLVLPENTSRRRRSLEEIQLKTMKTNLQVLKVQLQNLEYQLQHQSQDGDANFATNLIQFLRKVPGDKKLSTQISILNILLSVLG